MSLYLQAKSRIKKIGKKKYGSMNALAKAAGVVQSRVSRWYSSDDTGIQAEAFMRLVEATGGSFVWDDAVDEIVSGIPNPWGDNEEGNPFVAIQRVPWDAIVRGGVYPDPGREDWVVARADDPYISGRDGLYATVVLEGSRGLKGVASVGDTVIFDRHDVDMVHAAAGAVHLVRDLFSGEVSVRRVTRALRQNRGLVFVVGDEIGTPPSVYDIRTDLDGDLGKVLIGRVVGVHKSVMTS